MNAETAKITANLKAIQHMCNDILALCEQNLETLGEKTVIRFPKMEVK